jgi:hypothetical protein
MPPFFTYIKIYLFNILRFDFYYALHLPYAHSTSIPYHQSHSYIHIPRTNLQSHPRIHSTEEANKQTATPIVFSVYTVEFGGGSGDLVKR